jgi:hypothetical protein
MNTSETMEKLVEENAQLKKTVRELRSKLCRCQKLLNKEKDDSFDIVYLNK